MSSEPKTKRMVKMSVDAATQTTPSKSAGLPKPKANPLTGLCIQLVMLALMLAGFVALIVLIVRQDRPETHAQLLCQGLEPSKVERQDASAQQSAQQQPLTSGEDWGIGSDAGDREVDVDVTIHKHYSAPIHR